MMLNGTLMIYLVTEWIDVFTACTFDLHVSAAFGKQFAAVFAAHFAENLHLHSLLYQIECLGL